MSVVPRIETPRLKLRGHTLADFADCVAMWSDPAITKYTTGKPSTEQQTWQRMCTYLGHWQMLGFGYWAVELKETGKYIGEMGFADFKREIKPSLAGIPELGWALATHAHGKGYAIEALRAIVSWGDGKFESARSACIINPENTRSIKIAEKLGFREELETQFNGATVKLFYRTP